MSTSRDDVSRRGFLGGAAAAAAFSVVPSHVMAGSGEQSPSDTLNIAGIGVGSRGGRDVAACDSENIVALCDVDTDYAAGTFKKYPEAEKYTDYRRMLDEMGDTIDAVIIGTPDHTHAVIAAAALDLGMHVYCEKPLAHSVWECRKLAEKAREADVTAQLGIQGHSTGAARRVVEWIRAGVIGEVREVQAWCDLSYYPPGRSSWSPKMLHRPEKGMQVPDSLDWDLWIGPAAMRPYHEVYHPRSWRAWWEFGSGMTCDRGVHTLDPVVWALDLGHPESVGARARLGHNDETHPLAAIVTYRFPEKDGRPPVKLTWYEGLRPPRPPELKKGQTLGDRQGGALFKGTKASLTCGIYGGDPRVLPLDRMGELLEGKREKTLPRIQTSHQMNWVQACKEGRQGTADFQYGGHLSELCQLGNVAKRVNDRFRWDPEALEATDLPEANKYVKGSYRDGWSL
ncbi:MAG: Gfo/Idh/MocA family oxidoreductase [Planctomycetota bacterium]